MTRFKSGRAASRFSKACLYKVSRKYSKNWLRKTNIKSNLTPEIKYTLKPSNYEAKPWFLHFTAQKSKCPRRFREINPEISRTCSMCPCRVFYECFYWKTIAGNLGSLKTQISQKIQKNRYLAKTKRKEKPDSQKARQGHIKHVCKISGSISQIRRGHRTLKEIGVLCLNQPVSLASRNVGISTNRRFHELEH